MTLALVGVGLGIALVPASVLRDADHARTAVRHLQGVQPVREISMVHRKRPSALVLDLVALLRDAGAGQ